MSENTAPAHPAAAPDAPAAPSSAAPASTVHAAPAAVPPVDGAAAAAADTADTADAAAVAGVAQTPDLAALQAELAALKDQYLRAQAEVLNARRRADEEVQKARKFGIEGFAESLLPVLDSLEAGLAVPHATLEQIREGSQATLRQLLAALERNKVTAIAPAQGERFDPHRHQAISVVPTPTDTPLPPNSIVTVLQKGYVIAERVLRPALVTVTAGS